MGPLFAKRDSGELNARRLTSHYNKQRRRKMTKEEKIEAIRQRARKNFSLGYNCAECVTEAVLSSVETGLPEEAKKMATGFGGGIGLFGDTCGALVGAVMAVSAVHGRSKLPEGEGKEAMLKGKEQLYGRPGLYRLFNQIPNRLKEKYNKTICRELTSQWHENWLCRDHALFCREIITDAAGIAAELILSDKNELGSKSFGENVEKLKD
jgi:C_GCAxxG_C_C family probable redox protein